MKVMLMSPPEQSILSEAGDRPSLGILYLASSLIKHGHSVEISDLNHDSYYTSNKRIEELKPEYIGLTAVSSSSQWIKDRANYLKQRFPDTQLIAGGPHATGLPEDLIDYFDYVVRGEGEKAIVDIVEGRLKRGIITAAPIENLEELSNPARYLLPLDKRYGIEGEIGKRGTLIDSSRGCIGSCFYCTKFLRGKGQRFYSLEKILDQMEEVQSAGFDWVYITDDCFTANRQKTIDLMDGMHDRKIDLKFEVMTRTDCVDVPLLKKMKENGLEYLLYGIEHTDDKVLNKFKKGCNVESIKRGVKMAKDLDIKVVGSFILNLPGATEKTMYDCLEFAKENLDFTKFYGLQAYPGTPLWDNPERFGYTVTSRDIKTPISSNGETNVESENMPKEKAERIVKDIRKKWKEYKNSKLHWK